MLEHRRAGACMLLSLAGALSAFGGTAHAAPCDGADRTAAELSEARMSELVLCVVRTHRADAGEGALRRDETLALAASRHSEDMVRRRYFSHTSPGGDGPADRLRRIGYFASRAARSWSVGEVLAWGVGTASTPRRIVRGWLDSPAHRRVVLSARFDHAGVGVQRGEPGGSRDTAFTVTLVVTG